MYRRQVPTDVQDQFFSHQLEKGGGKGVGRGCGGARLAVHCPAQAASFWHNSRRSSGHRTTPCGTPRSSGHRTTWWTQGGCWRSCRSRNSERPLVVGWSSGKASNGGVTNGRRLWASGRLPRGALARRHDLLQRRREVERAGGAAAGVMGEGGTCGVGEESVWT